MNFEQTLLYGLPDKKKQEYVKVTYPEDIEHLPIVYRIHLRGDPSWILGRCHFHYGFVWLDSIYTRFKESKLGFEDIVRQIVSTYFHEFLHCYFFKRITKQEMIREYRRSKSWAWNEKLINNLTKRITDEFLNIDNNYFEWMELFEDLNNER